MNSLLSKTILSLSIIRKINNSSVFGNVSIDIIHQRKQKYKYFWKYFHFFIKYYFNIHNKRSGTTKSSVLLLLVVFYVFLCENRLTESLFIVSPRRRNL